MVIALGCDGDRVKPGGLGLVVAQAGPGSGLVEDLHHLGAEAAGELPVPADRVLAGDAALLVGGGAQRQPGLAEQPVMGDDAVPRRVHLRQPGPHPAVHGDGAAGTEVRPDADGQGGVGPDAGHDQHQVREPGDRLAGGGDRLDTQPPGPAGRRLADGPDGGAGQDLDPAGPQLGVHQGP